MQRALIAKPKAPMFPVIAPPPLTIDASLYRQIGACDHMHLKPKLSGTTKTHCGATFAPLVPSNEFPPFATSKACAMAKSKACFLHLVAASSGVLVNDVPTLPEPVGKLNLQCTETRPGSAEPVSSESCISPALAQSNGSDIVPPKSTSTLASRELRARALAELTARIQCTLGDNLARNPLHEFLVSKGLSWLEIQQLTSSNPRSSSYAAAAAALAARAPSDLIVPHHKNGEKERVDHETADVGDEIVPDATSSNGVRILGSGADVSTAQSNNIMQGQEQELERASEEEKPSLIKKGMATDAEDVEARARQTLQAHFSVGLKQGASPNSNATNVDAWDKKAPITTSSTEVCAESDDALLVAGSSNGAREQELETVVQGAPLDQKARENEAAMASFAGVSAQKLPECHTENPEMSEAELHARQFLQALLSRSKAEAWAPLVVKDASQVLAQRAAEERVREKLKIRIEYFIAKYEKNDSQESNELQPGIKFQKIGKRKSQRITAGLASEKPNNGDSKTFCLDLFDIHVTDSASTPAIASIPSMLSRSELESNNDVTDCLDGAGRSTSARPRMKPRVSNQEVIVID